MGIRGNVGGGSVGTSGDKKMSESVVASLSRVTGRLVASFALLPFISLLLCFSVPVFSSCSRICSSASHKLQTSFSQKQKNRVTRWWRGFLINLSYFIQGQKYTHLEAMEVMDVMRSYMTANTFPLESFNSMDRLHWTAQQKSLKGNKKEPSIYSFFNKKSSIKYTGITCKWVFTYVELYLYL